MSQGTPSPVSTQAPAAPQVKSAVEQESTTANPKAAGVPAATTHLTGDSAIPATVLAAYRKAAATLAKEQPGCHLTWPLLAGIGKVETDHGRSWGAKARITATGDVVPTILGPVLDGRNSAKLLDTDNGVLDGNRTYDRAVGPMQFVPSTWREIGRDGNGDGKVDPNNIWDASLGAASYLCANGRNLASAADRRAAILSYNPSSDYARTVLAWAAFYQRASTSGTSLASVPDPIVLGAGGVVGESPSSDDGSDDSSYEDADSTSSDAGDLLTQLFGGSPVDAGQGSIVATAPAAKPAVVTKQPTAKPATKPGKPGKPTVTPGKPTTKPATKPTPACVAPGVALIFTNPVTAVPVDGDHDSTYDALRVTTTLTATKAGPYTFVVELLDADHYAITSAVHTVHLKAGKQNIVDELSGHAIGDAGASGPVTLQVSARKAASPASCAMLLPSTPKPMALDPSHYDGWTVTLARLRQRLTADIAAGLIKKAAVTTLPAALQTPSADAPDLSAFIADLGDTVTVDPTEKKRLGSLAQRLIDQAAAIASATPSPSSSVSPTPSPTSTPTPSPSVTSSLSPTPSATVTPSLTPSPSLTPTPSG